MRKRIGALVEGFRWSLTEGLESVENAVAGGEED